MAQEDLQRNLRKLNRPFFNRGADVVAPDLLGGILSRRVGGVLRQARIIETEAYVGMHDLACHASKGRTARTQAMFGPAGLAYVYFVYGMHCMFNIVTAEEGNPQAVLLRAAAPLGGWAADLGGPGKLARAYGITLADMGLDITGDDLYIVQDTRYHPRISITRRIGVEYAGVWRLAPLRFVDRVGL